MASRPFSWAGEYLLNELHPEGIEITPAVAKQATEDPESFISSAQTLDHSTLEKRNKGQAKAEESTK